LIIRKDLTVKIGNFYIKEVFYMLYFIVFLSGAVLMSMEMAGSRVMAPAFGNSIYVWGALITVVMAALTLGYYLGGRTADRYPYIGSLGIILLLAGCAVGFLPLWSGAANQYLSGYDLRTGSLLAAWSFFFLPGVLLAMVSPYGIKLAGNNLTTLGNTAGRLSAISSAGSIIGTLATSFFLIPAMGIRHLFHMLGILLFILAFLSLWSQYTSKEPVVSPTVRKAILALIGINLVLTAVLIGSWWWSSLPRREIMGETVLYERDTLYHHVAVRQLGSIRYLHFDNSYQSGINLKNPLEMVFEYTSYLHLGLIPKPDPQSVLFIGLGGGSAPTRFLNDYPSIKQLDAVEIDPEVIRVAYQYFQLPRSPRLKTTAQDGRLFIREKVKAIAAGKSRPYDMVVLDAYNSDAIPYHLTTLEFLDQVKQVLSPDGVVISNVIGSVSGAQSRFFRAFTRTLNEVFPQVYLFPINGWSGGEDSFQRNIIVIATRDSRYRPAAWWKKEAERLTEMGKVTEKITAYVQDLIDDPRVRSAAFFRDVPILTDDYAPVDILQHIQR